MGKDKDNRRHRSGSRKHDKEQLHHQDVRENHDQPREHHREPQREPHQGDQRREERQRISERYDKKETAGYQLPDYSHQHPHVIQPPHQYQYSNQGYAHNTLPQPLPITAQPLAVTPQTTVVQPQSTTNNNIMVMPDGKTMPQNIKKWSTGLLGCCNDCGVCFCVLFCLPCVVCKQASRLSENCCVPFIPGGMMALRTKLRTLFGIRGSICCDCCEMTYCTFCAVCQMDRELDRIGL